MKPEIPTNTYWLEEVIIPKEKKIELWGDGEWASEVDWIRFDCMGYHCEVFRNYRTGIWCGYVTIPETHPWFEKDYHDIKCDVHGGLTFGQTMIKDNVDKFLIGFDCGHSGDLIPGYDAFNKEGTFYQKYVSEMKDEIKELFKFNSLTNPSYKNLRFAIAEVLNLVTQVAAFS